MLFFDRLSTMQTFLLEDVLTEEIEYVIEESN